MLLIYLYDTNKLRLHLFLTTKEIDIRRGIDLEHATNTSNISMDTVAGAWRFRCSSNQCIYTLSKK